MLSAREKRALAARWWGESLRETGVLILVFVPLDWLLGMHGHKLLVFGAAVLFSSVVTWIGIEVGYHGEAEGAQDE